MFLLLVLNVMEAQDICAETAYLSADKQEQQQREYEGLFDAFHANNQAWNEEIMLPN